MAAAKAPVMNPRKLGAIVLTVWCVLEAFVAIGVTALTLAGATPVFAATGVRDDGSPLRRVIEAQAMLANPCIAALASLVVVVVWTSLVKGARWALPALAATLLPLQGFAFVSDGYLGHRNVSANIASTLVLVGGLALARAGAPRAPAAVATS